MKYGKNQMALIKFLDEYPGKWHSIKGRTAWEAVKSLSKHQRVLINQHKQVCGNPSRLNQPLVQLYQVIATNGIILFEGNLSECYVYQHNYVGNYPSLQRA